jgi:hypothetical protein
VTSYGLINGGESVCVTNIIPVQVSKERVRVGEFMKDYDKLRSGRVSCINFARALDLCGFGLTPDEVMSLENRCASCMTVGRVVEPQLFLIMCHSHHH